MTDYTTLSNTAVGVGGLPSGATVTALRDNPIAIAEGDPTAPDIQIQALPTVVAGDVGTITRNAAFTTESTSNTDVTRYGFIQYGTLRVTGEFFRSGTGNLVYVIVLRKRNGVETTLLSPAGTTGTTPIAFTVDVPFVPGDEIAIQGRGTAGSTFNCTNAAFRSDGTVDIWPVDFSQNGDKTILGSWS